MTCNLSISEPIEAGAILCAFRARAYSVFDLNVQDESTTGGTGITGKCKTKHPRVPRAPRGLLFLNTQVKNALGNRVCP